MSPQRQLMLMYCSYGHCEYNQWFLGLLVGICDYVSPPCCSFLHKVIVVRANILNNNEHHYQNPAITCSGMYFLFLDKHRKPKTRKKSLIAILTQPKIFQQQIRIQKIILFNIHKNQNYKVKKIILGHTSYNNQTVTQVSDVQQLLVHVNTLTTECLPSSTMNR